MTEVVVKSCERCWAITVFPGESFRAPWSWVERTYHNLIYFYADRRSVDRLPASPSERKPPRHHRADRGSRTLMSVDLETMGGAAHATRALICGADQSAFSSDNSAFSAIFSEKSAFSGSRVIASDHKHFQFNELIDGITFAKSLVEVTGDAKARTTF